MSDILPIPLVPVLSPDNPYAREELVVRFKQFQRSYVQAHGKEELLKVYCHALCSWILNPNINRYQMEMLFDEIGHASHEEALDDLDHD